MRTSATHPSSIELELVLPFCRLLPFLLLSFAEEKRTEHEEIEVGAHEAPIGIFGRAHNWLAANIERAVHHNRTTRQLLEASYQLVIVGVRLRRNGLNARRVVDVRHRWDVGPHDVELLDAPGPALRTTHGYLTLLLHRCDEEHVRRFDIHLEVIAHALAQHAWSEWTEALSEFDLEVHLRLHTRTARIAENASRAQRTRTKFHPAVEPTNNLFGGEEARHRAKEFLAIQTLVGGALALRKASISPSVNPGPRYAPFIESTPAVTVRGFAQCRCQARSATP